MSLTHLTHTEHHQTDPAWLKQLVVVLAVLAFLVLAYAGWRFVRSDVGPPEPPDMLPPTLVPTP